METAATRTAPVPESATPAQRGVAGGATGRPARSGSGRQPGNPPGDGRDQRRTRDGAKEESYPLGADIVELAPLPGSVVSDFLAARLTYRMIGLALGKP